MELFPYFFYSKDKLSSLSSSEFEDGKWCTCDCNILFDYYAYNDDGRSYLAINKDGEYYGFFVNNNKTDVADEIADATYDFFDGKAPLSSKSLKGKGYITEMDSKEKDHKNTLSFLKKNEWVKPWSLFMMFKRKNAMAAWHTWPKEDQEAIDHDTLELTPEREYEIWVQMKLYEQWMAIKKFANKNGIRTRCRCRRKAVSP